MSRWLGMISVVTFAYLRPFSDLGHAVIMVQCSPALLHGSACSQILHLALRVPQCPATPEQLITGNVTTYFDYFYEAIAARKDAITQQARDRYVASYSDPGALT